MRTSGHRSRVIPPALPSYFHANSSAAYLNTETGSPPVIAGSQLTVTGGYDPLIEEDEQLLLTTTQLGVQRGRHSIFSSSLQTRDPMLVPASRGASCYVEGSRGPRIVQRPCGLSDGVLDQDWHPTDDPRCSRGPCPGHLQRDHRDVTITFRRAVRARLLVVRGCTGCVAEVSRDGRHFANRGEGTLRQRRPRAGDVPSGPAAGGTDPDRHRRLLRLPSRDQCVVGVAGGGLIRRSHVL